MRTVQGTSLAQCHSSSPMRSHVLLKIGLAREQELQEAQALASQGLIDAQEHEIVFEAGLRHRGAKEPPAGSYELEGVLGAIIVPGNPVVVQEGKQSVPVPLDPSLVPLGDL